MANGNARGLRRISHYQHQKEILDLTLERIGGCGNRGCIIVEPKGMHTNGPCQCSRDRVKMYQSMLAYRRFVTETNQ